MRDRNLGPPLVIVHAWSLQCERPFLALALWRSGAVVSGIAYVTLEHDVCHQLACVGTSGSGPAPRRPNATRARPTRSRQRRSGAGRAPGTWPRTVRWVHA
jgi:hypothetical protein